jgi:hypothetical protein
MGAFVMSAVGCAPLVRPITFRSCSDLTNVAADKHFWKRVSHAIIDVLAVELMRYADHIASPRHRCGQALR